MPTMKSVRDLRVRRCVECPAMNVTLNEGVTCNLVRNRESDLHPQRDNTPPTWCPLREKGLLIRLSE